MAGPRPAAAQALDPGAVHRVYLTTGEPLPSYGEPAIVDGRVIFLLIVSTDPAPLETQLVTLPGSKVDVPRTRAYSDTLRAARYAATRGEAEYAAISDEVSRALDALATIPDRRLRLDLALEARRRLLAWPSQHFGYRATDIQTLATAFDDVVNQLRVAAGEPALLFELVTLPATVHVPLLASPTGADAATLTLIAAAAADVREERRLLLQAVAASAAAPRTAVAEAARQLRRDRATDTRYARLFASTRRAAEAATRRGRVTTLRRLQTTLARRDRALGGARPAEMAALQAQLTAMIESARTYRVALAAYRRQLPGLRAYARRLRPVLASLPQVEPTLTDVRQHQLVPPEQVDRVAAALDRAERQVRSLRPPPAAVGVQASLTGALQMAGQAVRPVDASTGSAAAAGALLLLGQARADLAEALRPPQIQ